jgi:cation:H+ antiporter
LVWLYFIICVIIVLFFGTKLSRYGDIIAEKTGLGGVWVGLLLLAIITSLPEIITGISAVSMVGGPEGADLALGTIFGSNMLNLFLLAVLDTVCRQGPLLSAAVARGGHIQSAALGMVLIAFAGAIIYLSADIWPGAVGRLGVYGFILVIIYIVGSRLIFKRERQEPLLKSPKYDGTTSRKAYAGFAVSALAIIGAGTWLALIGDEISTTYGLGASFVGTLLLAITTSLPELVVALAAMRLGSPDMAIADILGSNMFNIGIGVFFYDLFSSEGPIFSLVSKSNIFTAGLVVLMTLVVILGLVKRSKGKTFRWTSWYSVIIAALYLAGAYVIFTAPWD